jgi:hypothetical protein
MAYPMKQVCITLRLRGTTATATVWGKKNQLFRGSAYGIEIQKRDWDFALRAIRVKTRASKSIPYEVVVQYIENERKDISCVVVMPINSSGVYSSAVKLGVDPR